MRSSPKTITIVFWVVLFTCAHGEKIKCDLPHDKHVYLAKFYFFGDLKLGVRRSYSCIPGYRKTAREATCTQDGWKPEPLCTEIFCNAPKIPNAEMMGIQRPNYKTMETVQYRCPSISDQTIEITCDVKGQWTGIQPCSDDTCQEQELKNVQVIFRHPDINPPYLPGQVLVFICTDVNMKMYGQRAIECQSEGRWSKPYPHCGGTIECSTPTRYFVTLLNKKDVYNHLDILRYKCNSPYNETSEGALMCQNGNWNTTFACTSKICPPPPYLENGDYTIKSQVDEVITEVYYVCQSYFVLNKQQEYFKCHNGKWEAPPKCLKPCEINEAVEMYNLQPPGQKVYVRHENKYRLNCTSGWTAGGALRQAYVDVQCSDGNLRIDKSCDIETN